MGHHHLLLFQFFLLFRGMKIEKEIFPAGTDSRYFREVGMQFFYNLPVIYLGGYCLEVLPRIFLVCFLKHLHHAFHVLAAVVHVIASIIQM